jgi:hypothetical protein
VDFGIFMFKTVFLLLINIIRMLSTINFTSTSAYKALQLDQSRLASTTIAQLFKNDATRQEKYSQTFNAIF